MANRLFKQFQMTLEAGVVKLYGTVNTSTLGAISTQTSKGFTVVKTPAKSGRYTVTLADFYVGLLKVEVSLTGAPDTAYPIAKGIVNFRRNVLVSTAGKTFDIQFARADTMVDAEVDDASSFRIEITLKNTQAF